MLTLDDVAKILNVSAATVRRLIEDGELKAIKVRGQWRVKQSDLDKYIEKNYR